MRSYVENNDTFVEKKKRKRMAVKIDGMWARFPVLEQAEGRKAKVRERKNYGRTRVA